MEEKKKFFKYTTVLHMRTMFDEAHFDTFLHAFGAIRTVSSVFSVFRLLFEIFISLAYVYGWSGCRYANMDINSTLSPSLYLYTQASTYSMWHGAKRHSIQSKPSKDKMKKQILRHFFPFLPLRSTDYSNWMGRDACVATDTWHFGDGIVLRAHTYARTAACKGRCRFPDHKCTAW